METVRYNYRLRPGAVATRALLEEWGRCRWLWNEAVHQQRSKRKPTFCKLSRQMTDARARSVWLRAGSQVAQQQMLRTYSVALDRSFKVKGCGRPVLKRRKRCRPSLEYTVRGFSIQEGRLRLPHGVSIPVVWSRDLLSDPTSVRVFQDSLGHWYASFVVSREDTAVGPETDGAVGIDWGVATTATASDAAYDLPFGGHRKRCQAELAKAQRKMARRRRPRGQKPSKGYADAKRQAARLQKKAARQNTVAASVWAAQVVAANDVIGVEDFQAKFLAKSKNMARKAADAAIGATKRELIARGRRAGRKVVLVPPAYTTMTCSECLARAKRRMELGERTFRCEFCGYTAERDRNSARLVLALARKSLATVELDRASADGVRHFLAPFEGASVVLPDLEIPPGFSRREQLSRLLRRPGSPAQVVQ